MTSVLADLRARRLTHVDWFLTADECEFLRAELEFAFWRPSLVVRRDLADELVYSRSDRRTSHSTDQRWFSAELLDALAAIEARLCDSLQLDRRNLELWQAVRYRNRARFRLHHDAGLFARDPEGDRQLTLLLYLETPLEGGSTVFPALGLRVRSVAGRLLVWNNLLDNGNPDPDMRHAAQPVRRGGKSILTTWSRQHPVPKESA